MAAPRDAYARKADTLAKLRARHADIWVATAALADAPAQQQTARNIALPNTTRPRLIGIRASWCGLRIPGATASPHPGVARRKRDRRAHADARRCVDDLTRPA